MRARSSSVNAVDASECSRFRACGLWPARGAAEPENILFDASRRRPTEPTNQRAARASRKLHETNHPYAEKLEVNAHVGADLIDPSLHPDAECRGPTTTSPTAGPNAPSRMECIGRSVVHHMAHKHGLDPDSVRRKLQDMGLELGESLKHVARAAGARAKTCSRSAQLHRLPWWHSQLHTSIGGITPCFSRAGSSSASAPSISHLHRAQSTHAECETSVDTRALVRA